MNLAQQSTLDIRHGRYQARGRRDTRRVKLLRSYKTEPSVIDRICRLDSVYLIRPTALKEHIAPRFVYKHVPVTVSARSTDLRILDFVPTGRDPLQDLGNYWEL